MNLNAVRDSYIKEFEAHFPNAKLETRWGKQKDLTVLHVSINGDRQEPLTIDQTITAIATFQERGRPVTKKGVVLP